MSSAQQTVDKLISQTQDAVKLLRKNEINNPSTESGGNNADVVIHAERLIHDSEKAKQVSCMHMCMCMFLYRIKLTMH